MSLEDHDQDLTRSHIYLAKDTIIGHYRIIEKIGAGGMGEVYLAEDTQLNRKVALKFLPTHLCQDADCRARFTREAQAAAKLNHPNIITIFEVGEHQGRPFFAMEYVEGTSLGEHGKSRRLSWREIIDISIQIAEGFQEAHLCGVVHRDIKPSNILVDKVGRVKILDFGLATIRGTGKLTKTGSTLGTLHYMSPEQTRGEVLDERTDVFSLGVILYEIVTGQLPFQGEHEPAIMYAICYEEPEPLIRFKSGVSENLQGIIGKALAKDKKLRYQSAAEMLADLIPERETLSRPEYSTRVNPQKKRLTMAAGIIFFALIVIGGIYLTVIDRAETPHIAKQRQVTFVGDVRQCALSPDGTYLAYGEVSDGRGRVLVQDLEGGEPLQVADCERVYFLHWSPSGTELLMGIYAGREYMQFMMVPRLGGTAREYLTGRMIGHSGYESAAWSPDGASFVAHSGFSGRPFTFVDKKSGDTSTVKAETAAGWLKGVTWSPRGDRLLFRIDASQGSSYWTMKTDGTELRAFPCGAGFSGHWSSNGEAVYYLASQQASVSLMKQEIDPIKGSCRGEPRELLSGLQTSGPISISADGDRLIYPRSDYSSNLWLVVPGASNGRDSVVQLTFGTAQVSDPAFSPDGRMVAFAVAEFAEQHIYTMPLTGGQRKRLTYTTPVNSGPSWSADGRRIAFICWHQDAYRVAVMNADGSNVRYFDSTEVTSVPHVNSCTWVAGQSILYQREGNRNFSVLNTETGVERPLISNDSVGWLFRPTLSPDGKTLAVYWNRSLDDQMIPAGRGIWTMSLDGSDQRIILQRDSLYAPLGWSSDGSSVYVYANEMKMNPDVLILPVKGGKVKKVTGIPLRNVTSLRMSPDGSRFICCVGDQRSDIWLVEDFDPDVK